MTIVALLLAFQDPLAPPSSREGWIGVVCFLIPTMILVWEKSKKGQAEREASQVVGYKDMLDRQTANVVRSEADKVKLAEENGSLKDKLTNSMISHSACQMQLDYAQQELKECRDAAKNREGGERVPNPPG